MRVAVVVCGFVVSGVIGFFLGMVTAEVVVNTLGPFGESEYMGIKVLVPLATAVMAAVVGGMVAARRCADMNPPWRESDSSKGGIISVQSWTLITRQRPARSSGAGEILAVLVLRQRRLKRRLRCCNRCGP